jgi:hypothetical protein
MFPTLTQVDFLPHYIQCWQIDFFSGSAWCLVWIPQLHRLQLVTQATTKEVTNTQNFAGWVMDPNLSHLHLIVHLEYHGHCTLCCKSLSAPFKLCVTIFQLSHCCLTVNQTRISIMSKRTNLWAEVCTKIVIVIIDGSLRYWNFYAKSLVKLMITSNWPLTKNIKYYM